MRNTGRLRIQALVLASTLVLGGLGLPLLDAVLFHSTQIATTAPAGNQVGPQDGCGVAHLLGCAVLTAAVVDRSLPAVGAPLIVSAPRVAEPRIAPPAIPSTQTDLSLSQSRAPPSA